MIICPRCKSQVDELEQIPASTLPDEGGQVTATDSEAMACRRCIHEILEG